MDPLSSGDATCTCNQGFTAVDAKMDIEYLVVGTIFRPWITSMTKFHPKESTENDVRVTTTEDMASFTCQVSRGLDLSGWPVEVRCTCTCIQK